MNFSFSNYLKKFIIKNCIIIIVWILFFTFFIKKDISSLTILLIGIILMIYSLVKGIYQIKNLQNKKIIEKELNNCLFNIGEVYFTDKYIFNLDTLSKVYYEDILVLVPSFGMPIKKHSSIYLYITLYLKNGMKEKFTLDGDKDQDFLKFGEIVLEKNPNVFIGTLKEYEKSINNKDGDKNAKER